MANQNIESFPCRGEPNSGWGKVVCLANGKTANDLSELRCTTKLRTRCEQLREAVNARKAGRAGRSHTSGITRKKLEDTQIAENIGANIENMHRAAATSVRLNTGKSWFLPRDDGWGSGLIEVTHTGNSSSE